jgi:hypothetical protein
MGLNEKRGITMKKLNVETGAGMQRRHAVLAAVVLVALAGCANTKVAGGAAAWTPVEMKDGDAVPANTDPSRRTRVVVLPSDESPSAPRGANLAAIASAAIETILGSGGVEVVERSLAGRLDQELKLAEMKGTGAYAGPDVADYAVRVVMGPANGGSSFQPASQFKNPLNGQIVNVPAGYTHVGTSNMTLRMYAVPSLKLVESMPIEGRVSVSQQPSPGNAIGLVRQATEDGIKGKRAAVLNEFSPKGYITERRVKDKASIFRVQLGKQTGAKTGDSVEIVTLQKVGNSYDEVVLGKGRMSDIVGNEGSWILVDDEKIASRVRKYDYVKVKHGGLLDGLIPANLTNMLK